MFLDAIDGRFLTLYLAVQWSTMPSHLIELRSILKCRIYTRILLASHWIGNSNTR